MKKKNYLPLSLLGGALIALPVALFFSWVGLASTMTAVTILGLVTLHQMELHLELQVELHLPFYTVLVRRLSFISSRGEPKPLDRPLARSWGSQNTWGSKKWHWLLLAIAAIFVNQGLAAGVLTHSTTEKHGSQTQTLPKQVLPRNAQVALYGGDGRLLRVFTNLPDNRGQEVAPVPGVTRICTFGRSAQVIYGSYYLIHPSPRVFDDGHGVVDVLVLPGSCQQVQSAHLGSITVDWIWYGPSGGGGGNAGEPEPVQDLHPVEGCTDQSLRVYYSGDNVMCFDGVAGGIYSFGKSLQDVTGICSGKWRSVSVDSSVASDRLSSLSSGIQVQAGVDREETCLDVQTLLNGQPGMDADFVYASIR